jgi:hypothetical protein
MRRWDKIRKVEDAYNRKTLRKLSMRQSFKILTDLYEFGAGLAGKKGIQLFRADHISAILAVKNLLKPLAK